MFTQHNNRVIKMHVSLHVLKVILDLWWTANMSIYSNTALKFKVVVY